MLGRGAWSLVTLAVVVFTLVYLGMMLGRLPRLALDRTGVALLGAIVVVAGRVLTLDEAVAAVDIGTLALLFALMVVSAQLRLGGFYTRVTRALTELALSPPALLGGLVVVVGVLSAIFSNDVVCLAVAPVLLEASERRGLNPVPFLLALACAANVGSAATLIGNPQNMLIGQALDLSFSSYLLAAAPVCVAGLAATWLVIAYQFRAGWNAPRPARVQWLGITTPRFDPWQTTKGLLVVGALLYAFLFEPWPREVVALVGAGVLLMSRRLHSRDTLALVDWQLLVLFAGLFVVNAAFTQTQIPNDLVESLETAGVNVASPGWLFALTVVLSNAVSNVPAVMLLLPFSSHELAGMILALASTFAGNLLIVGSIANIIVVDTAARGRVTIDWRLHARTGVPVTVVTLMLAAVSLWLLSAAR
jgi:Na+/H+ antiporter NhaD/arsenite permease-like protein